MSKYFIFDLDQTLVDSSHLEEQRQARAWDEIMAAVSSIKPYDGIVDLFRQLQNQGNSVGIFTSVPQNIAQAVCREIGIKPHTITGYHDASLGGKLKPKPDPFGMRLTLAKLGNPHGVIDKAKVAKHAYPYKSDCIAIGDKWSDTISAKAAGIETIGALWGTEDRRELINSGPDYLVESVAELSSILSSPEALQSNRSATHRRRRETLWQKRVNDTRCHLRRGQIFYAARERRNGKWFISHGNSLVASLKGRPSPHEYAHLYKQKDCEQFATELSYLLPKGAVIVFLKGSKKVGHPEYNDRWDRVTSVLNRISPSVVVSEPIETIQSTASTNSQGGSRQPEILETNLRWVGGLPSGTEEVWVIDDVITTGGHFESYLRLFDRHTPNLKVKGVFWTEHMWNDEPSFAF